MARSATTRVALKAWRDATERDGFTVYATPVRPDSTGDLARFDMDWADDWKVEGMVKALGGRLVISDLRVYLDPFASGRGIRRLRQHAQDFPAGGITATVLRSLPIGKILAQVRLFILAKPEIIEGFQAANVPIEANEQEISEQVAEIATATTPKRGRPSLGDDHYQRIARAYLALQAQGVTRGILNELAEQEGRPRETIRDWVHQARKRQFLSKGTPGRAGAEPGPLLTRQIGARAGKRTR
jgi:hypothetical protein